MHTNSHLYHGMSNDCKRSYTHTFTKSLCRPHSLVFRNRPNNGPNKRRQIEIKTTVWLTECRANKWNDKTTGMCVRRFNSTRSQATDRLVKCSTHWNFPLIFFIQFVPWIHKEFWFLSHSLFHALPSFLSLSVDSITFAAIFTTYTTSNAHTHTPHTQTLSFTHSLFYEN